MIDLLAGIAVTALEMICCKLFFEAFGRKRSENILRTSVIIIGLIAWIYFLAMLFYYDFLAKEILIIISTAVFMWLYVEINIGKTMILSLLFQALLLSIDYLALWLLVRLFDSIAQMSETGYAVSYMITALAKIFLLVIVLLIKGKFGKKSSDVLTGKDWLSFLLFPIFTIFIIIAMILSSGNIENQTQENVLIVIAFCLAGMNFAVFYLIDGILKREAEIRENEIFALKARHQTDVYRENFARQRKITHEYKNQIMCIEGLVAEKSYDELEKYVGEISGHLNAELDYIKTNNAIVDAILNSKYREMTEKNILFVFRINDLSNLCIRDEDIVVILSNLMNNAIEACEKCEGEKMIKMKFVKDENNVILSLENTYCGDIMFKDGKIQTSREQDAGEHGVGIENIIDVVTKYNGKHMLKYDGNKFSFLIMIPYGEA